MFLLVPMVAAGCCGATATRRRVGAAGASACSRVVGVALLPLISAQGGHGTQWIGEWALSSRLQAIPQYYLTGYSGAPLGHGIELLVALPILAGLGYGLWRVLEPREERGRADRARARRLRRAAPDRCSSRSAPTTSRRATSSRR